MARNLERKNASWRRWYKRHRAKEIARSLARKGAVKAGDPFRFAAQKAADHANEDARRLGQPHRLRLADILDLFSRQPTCLNCGQGRGLDHIQSFATGGLNTPENIQNLCATCNNRKGDGTVRPRDPQGRFVAVSA